MARTITLAEGIAAIRRNTDNRDSQEWVTDEEVRDIFNAELAELHAALTTSETQPHFRTTTTIPVVVGTSLYALPDDFYRLQEVTALFDSRHQALHQFMPRERAMLMNLGGGGLYGVDVRYRVQADNIEFLPATRAFNATLYYTSACPKLVDDADTTDGFDGYENAAIYGASATVREMEQMDPSFYMQKKSAIMKAIMGQASSRDAGAPDRVTDVTGALDEWPIGGWWRG